MERLQKIAAGRAKRYGMPEVAGRIAEEVKQYRLGLQNGQIRPLSPLAGRVNELDRLADMGQKHFDRITRSERRKPFFFEEGGAFSGSGPFNE